MVASRPEGGEYLLRPPTACAPLCVYVLLCCCVVPAGSLGPNTWIPWCYAMVAALVLFALNGVYQHRTW